MNGETLVVGSLSFKDITPEKIKIQVLEELAAALEVELSEIRYDSVSGKWEFQSVNWASGVEAIGIEVFLEHWKDYMKRFVCSLREKEEP